VITRCWPIDQFVEQNTQDAQLNPLSVCAEVAVTVVEVLEICVIFIGIVGVNNENQPFRIICVETLGPMVRLPPKAIIDDF
jgi:hypothetical protein